MNAWYKLAAKDTLQELGTSQAGLTTAEAEQRLASTGENKLEAARQRIRFNILISQFKDVMILILAFAAIVSFAAAEYTDGFVILAIIIGNAIIGYIQEYNAEQSIRMLQKMAAQHAIVMRDGLHVDIEAARLVPGDIILLEAGNTVPADARLLEVNSLKTEEAALTGESHSVDKRMHAISNDELLVADQVNMIFKGTTVSAGSGKAVVVATGMKTEMGKIAKMLQVGSLKTPLQERLAKFGKQLAVIVVIICCIVFGYGLLRGEPPLGMFLTALSLAVAALPEALPAVITIALARGAARMVKQKALVRKLPAVETLGSVTYICSDKTGTLTENKMRVQQLEAEHGRENLLMHAMMLNHELKIGEDEELIGDSTEVAFVRYGLEKGLSIKDAKEEYAPEGILPFDSERMVMSTLHRNGKKWLLLVKGAPVKIAEKLSTSQQQDKAHWLEINREWASQGQRVLFFASKEFETKPELTTALENELEMLGVAGIIDPPREEVIDAISECHRAGIKTVMITGDQPVTAIAIARELGIVNEQNAVALTGADLNKMAHDELLKRVEEVNVYARVSPAQKLEIVKALQERGQYVAMTGDGVNDAPSLKQANIGVAMGITGTDVSKESAHMILLDDNFATIVKAVKEGRRIYDNVQKFVLYVLACNLGEILTIFFAPVLGFAIPLLPIHILWINLVTDGLPGIALANEKAEKNIMSRPPRSPQENLFKGITAQMISTGCILAAAAFCAQWWAVCNGYGIGVQQTIVFTVLCFSQLGNALSVRSLYRPVLRVGLLTNPLLIVSIVVTMLLQTGLVYIPALHPVFHTVSLPVDAFIMTGILSAASLLFIELSKLVFRKKA